MNVSKKIIACTAVCAVLGVGVTAYATQNETERDTVSQTSSTTVKSVVIAEESVSAEESAPVEEESTPAEEENGIALYQNVPSENDEIINEKYFRHTFSDGIAACIPFIRGTLLDVEELKKLGSDTPYKNEICYIVIEFLDGTKRYFLLGDSPKELRNVDLVEYGICTYIEGGTGKYYEGVPDENGISIGEWR